VRGQSAAVPQLEEGAWLVIPDEVPSSLAETADIPAWRRIILRMHVKRILVVAGLLLGIGVIASLTIPPSRKK